LRLFKDIFREWWLLFISDYKVFFIARLFEDILKEMEASIKTLRLFQRILGFLKLFPDKWRLISFL
jgi:hypothetical protein